jgi:hypothetical protein
MKWRLILVETVVELWIGPITLKVDQNVVEFSWKPAQTSYFSTRIVAAEFSATDVSDSTRVWL